MNDALLRWCYYSALRNGDEQASGWCGYSESKIHITCRGYSNSLSKAGKGRKLSQSVAECPNRAMILPYLRIENPEPMINIGGQILSLRSGQ